MLLFLFSMIDAAVIYNPDETDLQKTGLELLKDTLVGPFMAMLLILGILLIILEGVLSVMVTEISNLLKRRYKNAQLIRCWEQVQRIQRH